MKKIDYDEIVYRVGFFRNKANLSARETSLRLGYNPQFLKTIENKQIELKVRTLLDFCDVVDISIEDFLYLGQNFNHNNKYLLELFSGLSSVSQKLVIDLMKNLK